MHVTYVYQIGAVGGEKTAVLQESVAGVGKGLRTFNCGSAAQVVYRFSAFGLDMHYIGNR